MGRMGEAAAGSIRLLPFQRDFERAAFDPRFDVAAMSGPRGLGKTFAAGRVLSRCMTPGDPMHEPGADYILIASSLEQARLTLGFVRPVLEPLGGFSFLDSAQRISITHRPTGSRLRVLSSSGKHAMGIVNTRLAVLDEPGAFDIGRGELMADALFGALGKVGSPLKLVMVGTLAPMATGAGHWCVRPDRRWDDRHDACNGVPGRPETLGSVERDQARKPAGVH